MNNNYLKVKVINLYGGRALKKKFLGPEPEFETLKKTDIYILLTQFATWENNFINAYPKPEKGTDWYSQVTKKYGDRGNWHHKILATTGTSEIMTEGLVHEFVVDFYSNFCGSKNILTELEPAGDNSDGTFHHVDNTIINRLLNFDDPQEVFKGRHRQGYTFDLKHLFQIYEKDVLGNNILDDKEKKDINQPNLKKRFLHYKGKPLYKPVFSKKEDINQPNMKKLFLHYKGEPLYKKDAKGNNVTDTKENILPDDDAPWVFIYQWLGIEFYRNKSLRGYIMLILDDRIAKEEKQVTEWKQRIDELEKDYGDCIKNNNCNSREVILEYASLTKQYQAHKVFIDKLNQFKNNIPTCTLHCTSEVGTFETYDHETPRR